MRAAVAVLLLAAVGWLWRPAADPPAAGVRVARGLLLVGVVGFAARAYLHRTGVGPLRRASRAADRVRRRLLWPDDPAEAREVPEARALRAAVRDEAGPALALLADTRPAVRVAALAALEYRVGWRPGEAQLVLKMATEADDPAVRAAAAAALAGADGFDIADGLGRLLRDPAAEVRYAAAEALLGDADGRWPLARGAVRAALADPDRADDGPLVAGRLPADAIADLTGWAAEASPLGDRAVLTLIEQYHRALQDPDQPELAGELGEYLLAADAPPGLRVELAGLLRDHGRLGPDLLDRMTDPNQPGPLRLFAAEELLRADPDDADGRDVLRGLARNPNRELAVAAAAVVQDVLGVDLGLPADGRLPDAGSKPAAEVAKRVLAWAGGARPTPAKPPGRSVRRRPAGPSGVF